MCESRAAAWGSSARRLRLSIWSLGVLGGMAMVPAGLRAEEGGALSSEAAASRFEWTLRYRAPVPGRVDRFEVVDRKASWPAARTAFIVCDMWDLHHCKGAVDRVREMAPRMNEVLSEARRRGALVIHAPSSCMAAYENHPARERARAAPKAPDLPAEIASWCSVIPAEERAEYPLDQSDGGCDTTGEEQARFREFLVSEHRNPDAPWLRETDLLEIHAEDAISDSGVEIWNLLAARSIDHVVLLGVHTNMCVLGRPFGLRQLAKNGKDVVLMRDMTDTMYNPDRWPYVSHFRGTDLIVAHIEKHVAPTVTSSDLRGGEPFRFAGDRRARIVVAIAEPIYETKRTLGALARERWGSEFGYDVAVLEGDLEAHRIDGLARALDGADLLVLSVRRQALPPADLEAVRRHVREGRPVLALRTSSHAFDARGKGPEGHGEWPDFDGEVLGCEYDGHHADGPVATIARVGDSEHPLLAKVSASFPSRGALYRSAPLAPGAIELLRGEIDGAPAEPVAWMRVVESSGARIVYTSLGHPTDFERRELPRFLENAVAWLLRASERDRAEEPGSSSASAAASGR